MTSPLLLVILLGAAQSTGQMSPTSDVSSNRVKATGATTSRSLRDRAADVYNVKDYGATGNGVTNDNAAIQAAINAAGDGTVFIPDGDYVVTGLTTTKSTSIRGSGWRKARLINNSSTYPTLAIEGTGVFGLGTYEVGGPTFEHFQIRGSSTGTAVEYNTQTRTRFYRVMVTGSYSKGFHLSPRSHSYGLTLDGCFIYDLGTAATGARGVYGRGYADRQINAISIIGGTEIQAVRRKSDGTLGHAVDLWASVVNIRDSIIEGNEGAGVYFDANDLSTPMVAQINTYNVVGNYIESNWDGAVLGSTAYNFGTGLTRTVWHLTIRDNMINAGTPGSTLSPNATAMIDLQCGDGAGGACVALTSSWRGLIIGPNYYTSGGTVPYVNLHNLVDFTATIKAPGTYTGTAFGTRYINIGTARIEDDFFEIDPDAPATGASYVGQMFQQTAPYTWWKAKAVTSSTTDWQPFAIRSSTFGRTDADALLTVGVSADIQYWTGALTDHRTITFNTSNLYNGARFRIVRSADATGSYNLYVGTAGAIKTLSAAGQWCEVAYDAIGQWRLIAYGSL